MMGSKKKKLGEVGEGHSGMRIKQNMLRIKSDLFRIKKHLYCSSDGERRDGGREGGRKEGFLALGLRGLLGFRGLSF